MQTIVYKLGGSLLDIPDIHARLQSVIKVDQPCQPLLIVGGGQAADIVRTWDSQFGLTPSQSHWLAIAAMRMNSMLLEQLMPSGQIVESQEQAYKCWQNAQIPILDVERMMRSECSDDALPESWDVTSDSIAAWVAKHFPADRLVLLKSVAPPSTQSSRVDNAIDNHFSTLAASIHHIEWINVRKTPHIRNPFLHNDRTT